MAFQAVVYQVQIVTHLIGIGIIGVLFECLGFEGDYFASFVSAFAFGCYLHDHWIRIFTTNQCFGD